MNVFQPGLALVVCLGRKHLSIANITRKKIINYVLNNHVTSKAGIAKELNLSMPTVLANVNDLLEKGVLLSLIHI